MQTQSAEIDFDGIEAGGPSTAEAEAAGMELEPLQGRRTLDTQLCRGKPCKACSYMYCTGRFCRCAREPRDHATPKHAARAPPTRFHASQNVSGNKAMVSYFFISRQPALYASTPSSRFTTSTPACPR
jgi:hypothetical protein